MNVVKFGELPAENSETTPSQALEIRKVQRLDGNRLNLKDMAKAKSRPQTEILVVKTIVVRKSPACNERKSSSLFCGSLWTISSVWQQHRPFKALVEGSNPSWFNSYPSGIATGIVVAKHLYGVILTLQSLVLG